jgi:hypothetical protein
MSHEIGRIVGVGTRIGPDAGPPSTPGVWEFLFTPSPALPGGDPRAVILHLAAMSFPAGARLEVDLRYGTDTFSAGADVWTRPIDPKPGPVRIRYFGAGTTGGVTLAEYASAEPTQTGIPGQTLGSLTNPDFFLHTDPYVEPTYETRLQCGVFDWENAACAAAGSVEAATVGAVCVIVAVHSHPDGSRGLSSCSGTLIGPDVVLTASHCATSPDELEVRSGSVCFGFQTTCPGARPAGYAPTFHKIRRIIRRGVDDWLLLQIDTPSGGLGIAPRTLRPNAPLAGESVFAVHHPHGAVKKLQRRSLVTATVAPVEGFDYAGGSSGSALFDAMGRIIGGALSVGPVGGNACRASYTPSSTILQELSNPPAPPAPFDVMLVIDRSGSMSGAGTSTPGRTKLQEARDAASLFVQLVRVGVGHRAGMVSFSTSATRPPDSALAVIDAAKKNELVGPPPYVAGRIGGLVAGGMTSIGDGLAVAMSSLAPGSANQRAILLLTDGLQNTPPMIESVEGTLGTTRLFAIGFGAEGDLDGPLLTRVARQHSGIYTRANEGLALKKFFSLAFGNIFEAGALSDPEQLLPATAHETGWTPFLICDEERITVIVGWSDPSQPLELSLQTPAGVTVTQATAGVQGDRGETWYFLRVPLPLGGERAGRWQWKVYRVPLGELPPPPKDVRFFVTIVADGGPRLEPILPTRRVYTGDSLNPLVALRYGNGSAPRAEVELEIQAPDAALGTLVAEAGLEEPIVDDDPLSAFRATLRKLGGSSGAFNLPTRSQTVELFDDGEHSDGAMEPDGVYGNPMADLTRYEGTYAFHARARYGNGCDGLREALWSVSVELGIDPDRTTVEVTGVADAPAGRKRGTIVVTPRDRFGSPLGPGRGDALDLAGGAGTTVVGPVRDNRDGSYSVDVVWDPDVAAQPGLVSTQPERPAVPLTPPTRQGPTCPRWLCVLLAIALGLAILIIILLLLT